MKAPKACCCRKNNLFLNGWTVRLLACFILLGLTPGIISAITADEIINRVDQNQVFDSQKGTAVMTVERGGKKLVKKMIMFGEKKDNKFFIEFTNPEDRGVKYLKIKNELWIYLPDADDIMKISGHMLRQGMMGSDISYEDLLSDEHLKTRYRSVLRGETNVGGTVCYDVELTATAKNVTYYKRRLLVDRARMVPVEYDLYAKSGRLLKSFEQSEIKKYGNRYYAAKMTIRDRKRNDSITTVEYFDREFDVPLSPAIFSKRNLRK